MTKFDKAKKSDSPVWYYEYSSLDSCRVKGEKKNTRIFGVQSLLRHEKGASRKEYRRN
jgi:hypothetical protein